MRKNIKKADFLHVMNHQDMIIDEYERSLSTTYRRGLWSRFVKGLKEYKLLSPGDKVCVCISGGKDSMCLAKLFMLLTRHSDFDFDVHFLVMNPGYNQKNYDLIKSNIEKLHIPATFIDTDIFEIANARDPKNACFLCAKMRRGALYNAAKKLGCNKIALGHHYDDVIETTLMNMLNSGSFQTMLPKLHSTNFEGMELIRPMYFVREKDIKAWAKHHNLEFIQCACRFTEEAAKDENASQRKATKKLIQELRKTIPQVEQNIFKSAENVTLDMILGYKNEGIQHSFLDDYDKKK